MFNNRNGYSKNRRRRRRRRLIETPRKKIFDKELDMNWKKMKKMKIKMKWGKKTMIWV